MIRLYLWFCRVLFSARGPWVHAGTRPSLRPLDAMRAVRSKNSDATRRENNVSCLVRRVGKANGSRECAPDDRLRAPTVRNAVGTARCALAHPTHMIARTGSCSRPDATAQGDQPRTPSKKGDFVSPKCACISIAAQGGRH